MTRASHPSLHSNVKTQSIVEEKVCGILINYSSTWGVLIEREEKKKKKKGAMLSPEDEDDWSPEILRMEISDLVNEGERIRLEHRRELLNLRA